MTIKQLIDSCENINESTPFMLYDSVDDYDNCSCNWFRYNAADIPDTAAKIAKFRIYNDFVAIALA